MRRAVVVALVCFAWTGCRTTTDSTRSTQESGADPTPSTDVVLDQLDARQPVPLLPMMANHQKQNMRDHLVAVQQIVAALADNDFDAVDKAAKRIGYSDSMAQMCSHMGAGAPGFTERALLFHRTADKIGVAARSRDTKATLAALSETMTTCTSCHATFKQRVVDEATWASMTHETKLPSGSHAPVAP